MRSHRVIQRHCAAATAVRMHSHTAGLMDNKTEVVLEQDLKLMPERLNPGLSGREECQTQPVALELDSVLP
ncbi:hypothetical protein D3C81_270270 [compost metagenome]